MGPRNGLKDRIWLDLDDKTLMGLSVLALLTLGGLEPEIKIEHFRKLANIQAKLC